MFADVYFECTHKINMYTDSHSNAYMHACIRTYKRTPSITYVHKHTHAMYITYTAKPCVHVRMHGCKPYHNPYHTQTMHGCGMGCEVLK